MISKYASLQYDVIRPSPTHRMGNGACCPGSTCTSVRVGFGEVRMRDIQIIELSRTTTAESSTTINNIDRTRIDLTIYVCRRRCRCCEWWCGEEKWTGRLHDRPTCDHCRACCWGIVQTYRPTYRCFDSAVYDAAKGRLIMSPSSASVRRATNW